MSTDESENLKSKINSVMGIGLSAAPFVFGAYQAYQNVTGAGSIPNPITGITGRTAMSAAAAQLGRDSRKAAELAAANFVNETADEIISVTQIDKLLDKTESQQAVIASILETLNDPSLNLGSTADVIRERLINAMDRTDVQATRQAIESELKPLLEAKNKKYNQVLKSTLNNNLARAKDFAPPMQIKGLAAPQYLSFGDGASLSVHSLLQAGANGTNALPPEAESAINGRLKQWVSIAGNNGNVEVVKQGDHVYGRLWSGGRDGPRRFMGVVPLWLGNVRTGDANFLSKRLLKSGESLQSTYVYPQFIVEAHQAVNAMNDPNFKAGIQTLAVSPEDFLLREGRRIFNNGMNQYTAKEYNTLYRNIGTNIPTSMLGRGEEANRSRVALESQQSVILFANTNKANGWKNAKVMDWLMNNQYKAGGISPAINSGRMNVRDDIIGFEGFQVATNEGSTLRNFKVKYARAPLGTSLHARLVQSAGRTTNVLRGQNLGGSYSLRNSTGKQMVTLMNYADDQLNAGMAEGMSYINEPIKVVENNQRKVLDPSKNGISSTRLLNKLAEKPGEWQTFSRSELNKLGWTLGNTDAGAVDLYEYPDLDSYEMRLNEGFVANGKHQLSIDIKSVRDVNDPKLFGFAKGMAKNIGKARVSALMKERFSPNTATKSILRKLAPRGRSVMISPTDTVRKTATQTAMLMGDLFSQFTGTEYAGLVDATMGNVPNHANLASNQAINPIEGSVKAFLAHWRANMYKKGMKDAMSAAQLGMVLTPAFFSEGGGVKQGGHVTREWLMQQVHDTFSDDMVFAHKVTKQMQTGVVAAINTIEGAQGGGDWKTARGSIEPRFAMFTQNLFDTLGVSRNTTASFLQNIYNRKRGMAGSLGAAGDMLQMASAYHGGMPGDKMLAGKRVSLSDLTKAIVESGGDLTDVIKLHDERLIVDLSLDDSIGSRALRERMGTDQIVLPRRSTLENMKDLKVALPNNQSYHVENETQSIINRTGSMLIDANRVTSMNTVEDVNKEFDSVKRATFKNAAIQVHGAASGKISGARYFTGENIQSGNELYLTDTEKARVAAMKANAGTGIALVDDIGFALKASDYDDADVGGGKVEAVKQFFLSGADPAQHQGLPNIVARQPMLAAGSVSPIRMYREGAVYDNADKELTVKRRKYKKLDAEIQKLEAITGKPITGFSDVAKAYSSKEGAEAADNFFKFLSGNLKRFMGGEGHGVVTFFREDHKVSVNGKSLDVDFGTMSRMFGDTDGDNYMLVGMNNKTAKEFMEAASSAKGRGMVATQSVFRSYMGDQIKGGLTNYAGRRGAAGGPLAELREQALKELALKESTGQMDSAITRMRFAVHEMTGVSDAEKSIVQDFLGNFEEASQVKQKHVPRLVEVSSMVSSAIRHAGKTGRTDALNMVLSEVVFSGQDFATTGFNLSDADLAHVPENIRGEVGNISVNLQRMQEVLSGAVSQSRQRRGSLPMVSSGQIERGMQDAAIFRAIATGQVGHIGSDIVSGETGFAASDITVAMNSLAGLADKMNAKALSPLALGTAASALMNGAIGNDYASRPLMGPGELESARMSDAVASQALLAGNDPGSPIDTGGGDAYISGMNQTNTTYVKPQNAYQLTGETQSAYGTRELAHYLSRNLGLSTNVRVNDTRRPITSNYMDRLSGEY